MELCPEEKERDMIVRDAEAEGEAQKRDKMLQAKEKFLQLKTEHEKYINEKNSKISATENRLNQKEMQLVAENRGTAADAK